MFTTWNQRASSRRLLSRSICLAAIVLFAVGSPARAVTPEQRAKVKQLLEMTRQAGEQFAQGDFERSAAQVQHVQQQLVELLKTRDRGLDRLAQPLYARLARAHGLLELEGVVMEGLPTWETLTAANSAGETASETPTSTAADSQPANMQGAVAPDVVSFAKQVAPLLVESCNGCHIGGQRAAGGLRMDTFAQLLGGGDSGPVVVPESDIDSLLIRKVKGEAGQRMPAGGRPPLSDSEISMLATWIREGARFDGPDVTSSLADVAQMAWASEASHDELFAQRKQRSLERWERFAPNEPAVHFETEQFLLVGNVSVARLETLAEQLTTAVDSLRQSLRLKEAEPLIRGGMTLYVLDSRYEYSELGRMAESRELPKDWLGHWQADALNAYGAIVLDPPLDDDQLEALLTQIVAGGWLGSFRAVPTWFAEGVARNLVFTSHRRGNPRIQAWQQSVPIAVGQLKSSEDLLRGQLDEETQALVGMHVTAAMLNRTNRRRFDKLLELLREGQEFDKALATTFAPAETLLKNWLGK